ncbi:MAG TPA: glyoxalase superfamily protein [Thermoanaerobaculia bacterium]
MRDVGFESMTPILRVDDLQRSLDYYSRILGFRIDWPVGPNENFASLSRDRCHIFLCEGDQGHIGSWTWIGVEDVDAVCQEYRSKGARIRHPPTNYRWAREMQVEDPDGNILRIGSERKEDEPDGEWLDMQGRRWLRQADGSFKQL